MQNYDEQLKRAINAAERGAYDEAIISLTQIAERIPSPTVNSYLAYSKACSEGHLGQALCVCYESIDKEPHNPVHYLLLGRIYHRGGKRYKAITCFQKGLKFGPNRLIVEELKRLGRRADPVIKQLDRGHFINRFLGKSFSKIGLR
jgi:tetratricopeptide (TPR) repeat protein